MKSFVKALCHQVVIDEIDYNLYERNNIIGLVSLVHNQLGALMFQKMIMYSQFASGFTKAKPIASFTRRRTSLAISLNV
jgi:hypothetical protein